MTINEIALLHTQLMYLEITFLRPFVCHMFIAVSYFISFFSQASKKKVYMLYNLEPDRTVTGGAWYCDQDFEAEFVDVLNQQCYRFLHQKLEATRDCKGGPIAARNISYASSKDVWKYISELGISKVIYLFR
jgi:hypothetical protein